MSGLFEDRRLPASFWRKVSVNAETGCWEWNGHRTRRGYAEYGNSSTGSRLGHRRTYERLVGKIPEGLQLDHLCRVRHCVNPAHLEPVTCQENLLRGKTFNASNAAKTSCPKGHPYNAENTRIVGARRFCKICGRVDALARYHRKARERAQAAGRN